MKNTLPVLKKEDFSVDGYLSESVRKKDDILGYDLYDFKEHQNIPFIRREGLPGWQRIGPFFFLPGSLDIAMQIIRRSAKTDLCVVDEVGPLELEGQGVWPALEEILASPQTDLLLVIRNSVLEDFLIRIDRDDIQIFPIEQKDIRTQLATRLLSEIFRRKGPRK